MRELGLNVQLAATEEDGTIEENAEIIGRIVRSESRSHSKLILVSTSKAGPETALALGRILRPDETTFVRAWLSVGGLIRGTPLADRVTTWPKSWICPNPILARRYRLSKRARAHDQCESQENEQH